MNRPIPSALLAAAVAFAAPAVLAADSVEEFYKNRQLTMIVGYTPSGSYDTYARVISRHLGKHVPGNPTVIVQNMPGASSMTASNHIYNVAPQDGTVMGIMSTVNPFAPLLGIDTAKFDPLKINWLGSPTSETAVVAVRGDTPVNSFEDAKKTEVLLGSTGPNGTSSYYARVFNEIFKTKFKLVYGYPGMTETFIAMERGEVQGHASPFWNSLKSGKSDWLKDGKLKILLQYGARRNAELPNVPFAADLPMSADDRQLFNAVMAPLSMGFPFLMGPGVPPDRLAALQTGYAATFKDPEFLADAKKLNVDVDPISPEDLVKTLRDSYNLPKPVIDRLKALYNAT
jgi:tripartite-type tricarboxylate transporter receptor subunit TctC